MIHKMQLSRKKAAHGLASDLRQHGPKLAKLLEARMRAVLEEGEEMPDVAHLLDLFGRMLVRESESIDAADQARKREGTEASHASKKLRQHELRSRVIWVRDQMRNAYGAQETSRLLSHRGRTPRGLEDLKILAEDMLALLPNAEPPKMKTGKPPDIAGWAEYLRPALADYSLRLRQLGKHKTRRADVVEQKSEAMTTFDRTFSRVVRLGELLYELAGEASLAKRLRPRVRRRTEQTGARPEVA